MALGPHQEREVFGTRHELPRALVDLRALAADPVDLGKKERRLLCDAGLARIQPQQRIADRRPVLGDGNHRGAVPAEDDGVDRLDIRTSIHRRLYRAHPLFGHPDIRRVTGGERLAMQPHSSSIVALEEPGLHRGGADVEGEQVRHGFACTTRSDRGQPRSIDASVAFRYRLINTDSSGEGRCPDRR